MTAKMENGALRDYVRKGIEVLDNKKGFFMMVEGGKVDWAAMQMMHVLLLQTHWL